MTLDFKIKHNVNLVPEISILMLCLGVSPRIFWGRVVLLELGDFDSHVQHEIERSRREKSPGKISREKSPLFSNF